MATIGEDLMTILGIIPTRDRAGIQRGTMADEAARSSQAAQAPQAPPKFQVPQEMRGPGGDLQLPAEVPTEYASGKAAPAPRVGLSTPLAVPPTQERVVASSPAAAPSPPVQKQASDVYLAALEQRKRQQQMMQVIGHLGMMANAFNRNPDSQASTRASLSGMINGAGGGGGNDLANLKTALDMRKEEQQTAAAAAARQRSIDALVAQGVPRDKATVETDNNLHTQRLGLEGEAKAAALQREEQVRQDLSNPAVMDAMSKATGMPLWQVKASILDGTITKKIDPSTLAEIRHKHASSADLESQADKRRQEIGIIGADFASREEARRNPAVMAARLSKALGRAVSPEMVQAQSVTEDTWKAYLKEQTEGGQADIGAKTSATSERIAKTDEEMRSTEQKRKADTEYAYYKDHPDAFARLHGLKDVDEARRIVDQRAAYDKYQETSGPSAYAGTAEYHAYERAERAAGRTPLGQLEWKVAQAPKTIKTPEEEASAAGLTKQVTSYYEDHIKPTESSAHRITSSLHPAQDMWTGDIITGSGKVSDWELTGRKTAAQLLGYSDAAVGNTQIFFNELKVHALDMRKAMPGAMSNDDRNFLTEVAGGKEMDAPTLRRLLTIQEKYERANIVAHNEDVQRRKAANPKTWGHLEEVPPPPPGRFITEDLATPYGQSRLQQLREHPTNKKVLRAFEEDYGKGLAKHYLSEGG